MTLSSEELEQIKKGFQEEYLSIEPYNLYISGFTLGKTIRDVQGIWNVKNKDITLRDDESLDDLCILATLAPRPLQDIELPSEYQGLRVFYRIVIIGG